ncbi:MAG: hypothetical protein L3J69_19090 [Desulfobacula sp.]|nr:hypothetical protein [Desulfobacula sp.]
MITLKHPDLIEAAQDSIKTLAKPRKHCGSTIESFTHADTKYNKFL